MSHAIAISSAAMGDLSHERLDVSNGGRDGEDGLVQGRDESDVVGPEDRDYDRILGVIEAITIVTHSCPNGRVVSAAKGALEAIKLGGSDSLKDQAYFVLTAIQGWRGDRAHQVHRSLRRYLKLDEND